jgi:peptidoglycan hydrolase-like protein with peptidoglycan-binding domain
MRTSEAAASERERFILRQEDHFGPKTVAVTESFQEAGGGHATGRVGLADWKSWIGGNVSSGGGIIGTRSGDFSGFVGWWQVSLNRWLQRSHRPRLVVDCAFGPETRAGTEAFQHALRIPATGVVDVRTFRAAERMNLTHFP